MSFISSAFASAPMFTREQYARWAIDEAKAAGFSDWRGAAVCCVMGMFQEAGNDPHKTGKRQIWNPGNHADPCYHQNPSDYPHDSEGDDGQSTGPLQQQMNEPGKAPWGWGGNYGDCNGTRRRMTPVEAIRMFYTWPGSGLKFKNMDASNAAAAGASVQRVQGSSFPDAYTQWWDEANALVDQVINNTGGTDVTWTGDPVWLEDVLRPALGSRLKTLPGWQDSGHGDFKDIRGVMVHHTGNSRETAQSIRNGRPDLEGPLANLHIAPNGDVTIVAIGVCWHAGQGSYPWLPTDMANWHMLGIECAWPDIRPDGSYDPAQRWPDPQIISMRDTCAALCLKLQHPATRVIGHKEYAGAAQGKWDPGNMNMSWFRGEVAKDMRGEFELTPPIGPILPPNYPKETWDQLRIEWEQLGGRTLVNAVGAIGEKLGIEGMFDLNKKQKD